MPVTVGGVRRPHTRVGAVCAPALVTILAAAALTACGTSSVSLKTSLPASASLVSDPVSLVNPFAGTGTGGISPGSIGEFPGADVPFGMMQWSPDTSPDRISGSGYSYTDSHISGFSLTHLSGTGCAAYGDVPVLPTVGTIGNNPLSSTDTFSHSHESASPGRYSVQLGPTGIGVALSVTTRTGLSQITFPETSSANVLFKVAGSANPVNGTEVRMVGDDELTGQVTSGQFCQTGTLYTLYFAAVFNRPFSREGTWNGARVRAGSRQCDSDACGAYVTFDTSSDRTVLLKIGISFVSVAGAEGNLAAEDPGWSLQKVESAATQEWNHILGRIRIGGGTLEEQRTFYTALYHSLLHPNVVSDYDGDYMGDDHRIHYSARPQYSNFSEWDIYRSEIELLSVVAPDQTGDMIQSLVNDAQQNGWLPKWAIADGDAIQMNGDSADPIIASAYAFGVRDFDLKAALAAMVKGADENESGHGLEIERQYLTQYLTQHYVDAGSLDLSSINYSIGGSVTLEYAIDDFSIAQFAQAIGDQSVYETMMQRAHNWEYLFNPATGYIQARNSDGSFPAGPAFQSDLFEPGGEEGFEEGNAIQYTWAVPQDLAALASLMGGPAAATAKLETFFDQLNAGRFEPYDWSGNEPSLWSPWEFDYFGAPWQTEDAVRRIVTTQYHDAPVNEPGNDDLGAISSWYVWAALGLYPVTPGTANLALASPLFPQASIELPDGKLLDLSAPGASTGAPYVHSLTVGGTASNDPWLPASVLSTGATLDFVVSAAPDRTWGAAPGDAPPSFATGGLPAVGFSLPSGAATMAAGREGTIELGLRDVTAGGPKATWTATATGGLTVRPSSGRLGPGPAGSSGSGAGQTLETLVVTGKSPGHDQIAIALRSTTGVALPPVVVNVTVRPGT
jgi:predicted alpha-1,2-mannosidase